MTKRIALTPRCFHQFAAALLGALALLPSAPAWAAEANVPATGPMLKNVLAHVTGGNTVGATIRETAPRADGYYHVDTPKMIARLQELHVNTYNYTVWDSPSDWDDLRLELLPAAQKAGLKVWVYLVPPTECAEKCSYPYRTDYVQWARAIAELSLKYPALEAWEMDDFTVNLKTFTPACVAQLQQTAHAINPQLKFFAVLLPVAVTEKWAADYGPVVDGVVAPFFDAPYNDTQRTSSIDPQINAAHTLLQAQGRALYFLIYVGRRFNSPWEPRPDYAAQAMAICLNAMRAGRLEGIVSYGTALDKHTPCTRVNQALDGQGRLSLARSPSALHAGEWASASQTITVDPNAPRAWLSFWHHDYWGPGDKLGLVVKEVLIDDRVVWSKDPGSDLCNFWMEGGTLQGPVELTHILKGKTTVTLTFRARALKDSKGYPIDIGFDRLRATGFTLQDPGFETGQGWKLADSGGALLAAIDRVDPDQPSQVFKAVQQAFARCRLNRNTPH